MNDDSPPALGSCPSLSDITIRFLKSRFLVSSTPITCMPMAGSPWKGMLAAVSRRFISRFSVSVRMPASSPVSIRFSNRFTSVYPLNSDSRYSCPKMSFSSSSCGFRYRTDTSLMRSVSQAHRASMPFCGVNTCSRKASAFSSEGRG